MYDDNIALALQLSEEWNNHSDGEVHSSKKYHQRKLSIVDPSWELIDPVPDICSMFMQFNAAYFDGLLAAVEVKWSNKMTLCAGICCYEGRGGLCCIKLSLPLLKLRPRKDLVETLLHEMIHALLFVTDNNKDHDGHGPEFHKHMYRINKETGSNITVYHSFHDEVNEYRQHWWRCNGPCVTRPPYYGIVRRAMNRAPSCKDKWHAEHQRNCGGSFIKIKWPENYREKKGKIRDHNDKIQSTKSSRDVEISKVQNIQKPSKGIPDYFKTTNVKPAADLNIATSNINKIQSVKRKTNHPKAPGNRNTANKTRNVSSSTVISTIKKVSIQSEEETNKIYRSSDENSSSNIYGFKMSANTKSVSKMPSFSGPGFTTGYSSTQSDYRSNTREDFLKCIEKSISKNIVKNKNPIVTGFKRNSGTGINDKQLDDKIDKNVGGFCSNKKLESATFFKDSKKRGNQSTSQSDSKKVRSSIPPNYNCVAVASCDRFKSHSDNGKEFKYQSNSKTNSSDIICIDDDGGCLPSLVQCPACPATLPEHELNDHLDECLV